MRTVSLFIAASIDGYIARKNHDIAWLESVADPPNDYGYAAFLDSIDTTLIGHQTYQQAKGFDNFPYGGKMNYIFSRSVSQQLSDEAIITTEDPIAVVKRLKSEPGKKIWLVGGSVLNATLLDAGLVDEIILSIIPVTLGEGVPLFAGKNFEAYFELNNCTSFPKGLVQLTYVRK